MKDFFSLARKLRKLVRRGTKGFWYKPPASCMQPGCHAERPGMVFETGMFQFVTECMYDYWRGMPEFMQHDDKSIKRITVWFKTLEDRRDFGNRIGQKLPDETPPRKPTSIWYPEAQIDSVKNLQWIADPPVIPQYPLYIISKGRWECPLTARALDKMGVPYHIVVEPEEYKRYKDVIDNPKKILMLPDDLRVPGRWSDLGEGSIPARNWVWEHSISLGAKRHWILDDNIPAFYRLNHHRRIPVATGAIFKAAEDFTDRYENIALSGFEYFMFAPSKKKSPPVEWNTRIYSCIQIQNNIPYRWRGKYNEDTDLSLRALKDGWCTALFFAFLAQKKQTMTMKGGNAKLYNTEAKEKSYEFAKKMNFRLPGDWLRSNKIPDDIWNGDGRLRMAYSLWDQHPDVVPYIVWKWGRWQHHVDYSPFETNPRDLKPGLHIPRGVVDEYGMVLASLKDSSRLKNAVT